MTQGYAAQAGSCTYGALSKAHALTSSGANTYCYDAVGNILSGGGRSYLWTNTNLPVQVTVGSTVESSTYNGDDARVKRVVSGSPSTTTIYVHGLWEQVVGGDATKYYTLSGQTVAMRTHVGGVASSTVSYLVGDHLGSASVAINGTDGSTTSQEFDPWGKVRSGGIAVTKRNFTGQYLDDTGLLFCQSSAVSAQSSSAILHNQIVGNTAQSGTPPA